MSGMNVVTANTKSQTSQIFDPIEHNNNKTCPPTLHATNMPQHRFNSSAICCHTREHQGQRDGKKSKHATGEMLPADAYGLQHSKYSKKERNCQNDEIKSCLQTAMSHDRGQR